MADIELPPITVTGTPPATPAQPVGGGVPSGWMGGISSLAGILVFHTTFEILYADNASSETEVKPGDFRDITFMFPTAKLLNFRYEEHITFQADELELIFPDPDDTIIKHKIVKGGWLKVKIHQWNADYPGSHTMADPGSFQIDQIKQSGPPTQTTLMASSVPISSTVKLTLKNQVRFGNLDLHDLANDVAHENGLGDVVWDVQDMKRGNMYISNVQQYQESDLAMLSRELRSRGLAMRFKDINGKQRLVVFDEQFYESKPPVFTIDFGNRSLFAGLFGSGKTRGITHWELTTQSQDIFSLATLSFHDPNTGQTTTGEAQAVEGTAMGTNEKIHDIADFTTPKIDSKGENIAQGEGLA